MGKPKQNGVIESFNARFQNEFLKEALLSTPTDARTQIDTRKKDYNGHRPNAALGTIPPAEFAMKMRQERSAA